MLPSRSMTEHRRDVRKAVSVAGGITEASAIEKRGHGNAEFVMKLTGGLGIVLRYSKHGNGVGCAALKHALEIGKRVLAGGAGNLEEGEEDGTVSQQFAQRLFGASGQVFETEIGSVLASGERLILSSRSHEFSVNSGRSFAQSRARGSKLLFLLLLDEAENVEALEFAVGEKAVDGVLLIIEHLEDGGELGHDEKLDAAAAQVEQLDLPAGPLE